MKLLFVLALVFCIAVGAQALCSSLTCTGECLNCGNTIESYCFNTTSRPQQCCGCYNGIYGFDCGACPASAQCLFDANIKHYYKCYEEGNTKTIIISVTVVAVVSFAIAAAVTIRWCRRNSYVTVEYTAGYTTNMPDFASAPSNSTYVPPVVVVSPEPGQYPPQQPTTTVIYSTPAAQGLAY